jgi:hypothetical protein
MLQQCLAGCYRQSLSCRWHDFPGQLSDGKALNPIQPSLPTQYFVSGHQSASTASRDGDRIFGSPCLVVHLELSHPVSAATGLATIMRRRLQSRRLSRSPEPGA